MSITLFYAGLLALWFLLLSARVIQKRTGGKINLGDGGDSEMLRRIRGHANFAEYVPLVLVLVALLEYQGLSKWAIHALGATLLIGRLLHGYAFAYTEKWFFGRFVGTVLTLLVLGVAALVAIWKGVGAL